ncbi:MAG TPA: FAD-dependent oxidoreductase [Candidatus Moranbacteria bacterium]|nr:FAD-dependent oxidoreductase [Candidatus Moranbacteria bacterium]
MKQVANTVCYLAHAVCYMVYDLAIVGAGPAGLSAAVYAARYGLKVKVVGGIWGGLASQTHEIGNWLGTEKVSGFEFSQKATEHARSCGVEMETALVDEISKTEGGFRLSLSSSAVSEARAVLLALGTKHRHLGVKGEKEFSGKGVSYCATCDGFFYRGKKVAIVGGSDSAAGAAVYLGDIAEKVYLLYRGDKLRCEDFWMRAISANSKIEVLYSTNIKEIRGEGKVEELLLDGIYEGTDILKVDGIFVEIGSDPNTEMARELGVNLDADGYIEVDSEGRTSVKGVWAAGDITTGSAKFKQIVTAAAEGAIAANSVQKYLKR